MNIIHQYIYFSIGSETNKNTGLNKSF